MDFAEAARLGLATAQQGVATAQGGIDTAQAGVKSASDVVAFYTARSINPLLSEMELKEAEAKLEKAEAKLEKAEAKLEKAKAELEKAEAKLEKAEAKLEKAEAKREKAKAEEVVQKSSGTLPFLVPLELPLLACVRACCFFLRKSAHAPRIAQKPLFDRALYAASTLNPPHAAIRAPLRCACQTMCFPTSVVHPLSGSFGCVWYFYCWWRRCVFDLFLNVSPFPDARGRCVCVCVVCPACLHVSLLSACPVSLSVCLRKSAHAPHIA